MAVPDSVSSAELLRISAESRTRAQQNYWRESTRRQNIRLDTLANTADYRSRNFHHAPPDSVATQPRAAAPRVTGPTRTSSPRAQLPRSVRLPRGVSGAARNIGPGLAIADAALEGVGAAAQTRAQGGDLNQQLNSGLSQSGAVLAGAAAGAQAGAALGTAIGGPVGGVIGGIAGGTVGVIAAGNTSRAVRRQIEGMGIGPQGSNVTSAPYSGTQRNDVTVPFNGGQSPGVLYNAYATGPNQIPGPGFKQWDNLPGPIGGIVITPVPTNPERVQLFLTYGDNQQSSGGSGQAVIHVDDVGSWTFSVSRADGLPDIGGNHPGYEDVPVTGTRLPSPAPPSQGVAAPIGLLSGSPASAPAAPRLPGIRPGTAPPDIGPDYDESQRRPAGLPIPGQTPITVGNGAQQATLPGAGAVAAGTAGAIPAPAIAPTTTPDTAAPPEIERPGSNPGLGPAIGLGAGIAIGLGTPAIMRGIRNRGASAPLGTVGTAPSRIRDPLTNAVSPPAQPPTQRPTRTGNNCGCNTPVLDAIQNLAGSPVPGLAAEGASLGAIMAKLNQMQQFAEKAWEATRIQKVLDVVTFIGVMHNAGMLSREVGETLGYVASNALAIIGIRDEEGNQIDVNSWFGTTTSNFFKSVLGEELYNGILEFWNKASSILRSASLIIWTIRSIFDGTQEVIEWMGENISKIGNALKRWRVVGPKEYAWMNPRLKSQDRVRRRYRRIIDGLEAAEDTASSFAMVTGEVREIQEEVDELGEQLTNFRTDVSDFAGGEPDPPATIPDIWDEGVTNSQGPEVGVTDFERGEAQ